MMRMTFLGQCGFVLDTGNTVVAVDPYLSDYLDRNCCTDEVRWERRFPAGTDLRGIDPDVVLLSHRHWDHLDPWTIKPYIDAGGNALFVGPWATRERLDQQGVRDVHFIDAGETLEIDDVRIDAIACAHPELHRDDEGHCMELSYVISWPGGRLFFGGDMMVRSGLVEEVAAFDCKVMLLPCNGRDAWRDAHGIVGNTTASEAARFAWDAGADILVPMHHDLYEINFCEEEVIQKEAAEAGVHALCMHPMQTVTWSELSIGDAK